MARFAFICFAVESDVGDRFEQEHDSRQLMFCDGYMSQIVYHFAHVQAVSEDSLAWDVGREGYRYAVRRV